MSVTQQQSGASLSPFELNEIIETLITSNGHDQNARDKFAEFFSKKPSGSWLRFNFSYSKISGSGFTGHTDEMGNVRVPDKDESKETNLHIGQSNDLRIGNYIVTPYARVIDLQHFWKAREGSKSQTETPQQWRLALDRAGKPEWFGILGTRPGLELRLSHFFHLAVIERRYLELWGPNPNTQHKEDPYVNISFGF